MFAWSCKKESQGSGYMLVVGCEEANAAGGLGYIPTGNFGFYIARFKNGGIVATAA
jgi:hypothetical protein